MGDKGGGVSIPNPWTINAHLAVTARRFLSIAASTTSVSKTIAPINATSTIKVPDPIVTKSSSDSDADHRPQSRASRGQDRFEV